MSDPVRLRRRLATPNWERLFAVFAALRQGWTPEEVSEVSHIDPWFLREIAEIVELEAELACWDLASVPKPLLRQAKAFGLTDARIAGLLDCPEKDLAAARVRERAASASTSGSTPAPPSSRPPPPTSTRPSGTRTRASRTTGRRW